MHPSRLLALMLLAAGCGDPPVKDGGADTFATDVAPRLVQFCGDCHSGAEPDGGLDLTKIEPGPGDAASDAWRLVKRKLRHREMPPKEEPQPSDADVARVLAWIDARAAAQPANDDPGRATMRLLSRYEYRRTVKDLVGVDFDAEARLPAMDASYGFDNIGDVASMSPALLEKYLAAAEEVAGRAIIEPDPKFPLVRKFAPKDGGAFRFAKNGSASSDVLLSRDGEYVLRARAFAKQAGSECALMAFQVDAEPDTVVEVKATQDAPQVYETKVRIRGGLRHVAVAFINDHVAPNELGHRTGDRVLSVEWMEITGPVDVRPIPEFQRKLLPADDKRPHDRAFAAEVVRRIADRAYRRPADAAEVERLAGLVETARSSGLSFERALQPALTAILVSPNFLYRAEYEQGTRFLDAWELATRLSYFLWSTMPDDELRARADDGSLLDPRTLEAQARRMFSDERASALVENFAVQWLELRRLDDAGPDPMRFPSFDDALRASMRRETEMFVAAVIRENRPLRDFLEGRFTFVDERLGKHYGMTGVAGPEFRRVALDDGRRAGLLTQASILTLTSNPTRTSPVKRGKFILDEIFAEPPPPPPPGVGTLDDSDAASAAATLKERMAKHRADPKCFVCHTRMDVLGMALENFDAVGRWRDRDGPHAIDTAGKLLDGRAFDGPAELRKLLASDDALARCLAERLTIYAIGRGPTRSDRDAVDKLVESLPGLDATFADLVVGVVKMDGFRKRRGEAR